MTLADIDDIIKILRKLRDEAIKEQAGLSNARGSAFLAGKIAAYTVSFSHLQGLRGKVDGSVISRK